MHHCLLLEVVLTNLTQLSSVLEVHNIVSFIFILVAIPSVFYSYDPAFQTLRFGDIPCCVSAKKPCHFLSPPCLHKLCRQRQ